MWENAYTDSDALRRLEPGSWVSALDLDGTLVTGREASAEEISVRRELRALLELRGIISVSTARTPEMVMSDAAREASRTRFGFTRPQPKWGTSDQGIRVPIPIEREPFFESTLNPEIINAFGTGVYVRKGLAYQEDRSFASEKRTWRIQMLRVLRYLQAEPYFAPIEYAQNYKHGKTDVMPLPYRIQLESSSSTAFRDIVDIKLRLAELRDLLRRNAMPAEFAKDFSVLSDLTIVDESHPEKGRFQIYLMPRKMPKHRAIEHINRNLRERSGRQASELFMFTAGDTCTDLRAGLYSSMQSPGAFVLAGGSRVARSLMAREKTFAQESLAWIYPRLTEGNRSGIYWFKPPFGKSRMVIIADEAFPKLNAPSSVLAAAEMLQ